MSDSNYSNDRAWSDRYLPAICKILGPLIIKPAPFLIDAKEATDLMVLMASDFRIAARVRRPGYAMAYPWEFTMRFARHDSGATTELRKVLDGFADWMVYAHAASGDEPDLSHWMVIDLHAFRKYMEEQVPRFHYVEKMNKDQRTSFISFRADTFPDDPPIMIASSHVFDRLLVAA